MYDENQLKELKPIIAISYYVDDRILMGGTFENIPENAIGACIRESVPFVAGKGELKLETFIFNLFVGKAFNSREAFEQNKNNGTEKSHIELLEALQQGLSMVVLTKDGFYPLNRGDVVFSTYEEMVSAINKIRQTFESVNILVQNAEVPRMHR